MRYKMFSFPNGAFVKKSAVYYTKVTERGIL